MNSKLALFVLFTSLVWGVKASAAEPRRITLGYSSIGPMATGFWMAKEIGAFEKHGIHAELIYISSGPVVIQALIGGDLQGGSAATNAVINAILNGAPILGVAGTSNRPYHRLYVQVFEPVYFRLRGKTLGVTRFGAITDNLTRILLRRNNLESGVTVGQLGATAAVGAAFQQRVIAGAVTSELRVGTKLPAKILVNLVDLGIPYSMQLIR
jgi:ABC-type nitrate/sulfonate/bicarbonate transport system substrate-binding protein